MIRYNRHPNRERGQVLTEQAFVLAAIIGIVLVVVARMGTETSSVFDQLSKVFPRYSASRGKQPEGRRPKRRPANPTAMASAGAPASASPTAAAATPKKASKRRLQGNGGGGHSRAKRKAPQPAKRGAEVSWGVTSTSRSGSGLLSMLIGR